MRTPKFVRAGAPPAHETRVRKNEICAQNEIAPSAKSSRNDALRHRGPRHRSAAVMSSHLTVGVRAAFELHSSRRGVPSQASENPAVFNSAADWAAVPTGKAHRLPKKCAGFIGSDGRKSRPTATKTRPASDFFDATVPTTNGAAVPIASNAVLRCRLKSFVVSVQNREPASPYSTAPHPAIPAVESCCLPLRHHGLTETTGPPKGGPRSKSPAAAGILPSRPGTQPLRT